MKYGEMVKHFWRALPGGERRRAERRAIPGLVAYYWDGGPPVGHPIQEISLTGMYLLTEQRWYLGTVVTMRLQQTESVKTDSDHSIEVHAKTVRWGTDGVGMLFLPREQNPSPKGRDPEGHKGNQKSLESFVRQV